MAVETNLVKVKDVKIGGNQSSTIIESEILTALKTVSNAQIKKEHERRQGKSV